MKRYCSMMYASVLAVTMNSGWAAADPLDEIAGS